MVESLDPLAIDAGRHELTGMEAWFDLHPSLAPPPRFRMAILTLIGIWPLVSVVVWLLAPTPDRAPFSLSHGREQHRPSDRDDLLGDALARALGRSMAST